MSADGVDRSLTFGNGRPATPHADTRTAPSLGFGNPNTHPTTVQQGNIVSLTFGGVPRKAPSRRLNLLRSVFDSDEEIEERTGKTIEEIKKGAFIDNDIIADKLAENDEKARKAAEAAEQSRKKRSKKARRKTGKRKSFNKNKDEVRGRR